MRPWLRWVLMLTLVLSTVALLGWPPAGQEAVSVAVVPAGAPLPAASGGTERAGTVPALPSHIPRQALEPAQADPFVGLQPPPPPAVVAMPVAPVAAPPAAPMPPVLSYRYLGRMVAPDGQVLVYLSRQGTEIAVSQGSRLDEGYVIEAITADAVKLHYPPLDTRVSIPIPLPEAQDR